MDTNNSVAIAGGQGPVEGQGKEGEVEESIRIPI